MGQGNSGGVSPPRMCSSASVSPKRSGGACTVPLSSSASLARNASLKIRPFSLSLPTQRVCEGIGHMFVCSQMWLSTLETNKVFVLRHFFTLFGKH